MRFLLSASALAVAVLGASAASAQDMTTTSSNWTGFYVGGQLGYAWQPADGDEQIAFDRDLDGSFGDPFPNFAPGYCGGAASSSGRSTGCSKDNDNTSWKIHAGYDMQFGERSGFVVGAVVDYGKAYLVDSVSAYSTTPASYTIKSRLKEAGSVRGRAGYSLSTGTLFYGTGGLSYGKIRNSFSTTNGVNTFTTTDGTRNNWGYAYGGGIEQKVGPISIGGLYLFNSLKNKKYDVTASGGAVGGPFTAISGTGTDFKRSFSKFGYHTMAATVSYHF